MSQTTLVLNEPISPPRIGGVAMAIAFHIVAFMLLMVPLSYAPAEVELDGPPILVDSVKPKEIKEPPPPPPPNLKLVENKPNPTPPVLSTPTPPQNVPEVVYNDANTMSIPYTPTQEVSEPVIPYVAPPSGPISLSTEFAPAPKYPPMSLRNGEEGTVILLVRVDAMGRPIEITIQKSSGFRDLDRAAKKHVLDTWRFHPAMHQGSAISALALVPVDFKIN
jgi:periplasmic protein TonB